jgi:glycosyltransferase involved in cell wall biosynthesis
MNVLLNAATVKYGGGLSEVLNLISALIKVKKNHQLFLIAPKNVGFEVFSKKLIFHSVPEKLLKKQKRFYLEKIWIKDIIINNHINIIFSLGNLPISVNHIKQVLFFDNPFTTTENLNRLNLDTKDKFIHKLRNYYFYKRLKYVNLIFAQTHIQKQKLNKKAPGIPIKILENAPSLLFENNDEYKDYHFDKKKIKLLAFTRYYPHKNLEILLNLANLIKQKNKNFQIILTIEETQHRKAKKLIKLINHRRDDTIINIGYVHKKHIRSLYHQVDALLLPTLLESFSTTYADSMYYGLPIFTSDLDFAKEVCGDAGIYFNPFDENDIFEKLVFAFSNDEYLQEKIKTEKIQIANYRSWTQLAHDTIKTLETLCQQ